MSTSRGADLITKAREEDIARGFDNVHNNRNHKEGTLAICATCYALADLSRKQHGNETVPILWPWKTDLFYHTPEDRLAELVKAGKFIAAEIDLFLYREEFKQKKENLI